LQMMFPERYWRPLLETIDASWLDDDPRFSGGRRPKLAANSPALIDALDEIFRLQTLDEWEERFRRAHIPFSPVRHAYELPPTRSPYTAPSFLEVNDARALRDERWRPHANITERRRPLCALRRRSVNTPSTSCASWVWARTPSKPWSQPASSSTPLWQRTPLRWSEPGPRYCGSANRPHPIGATGTAGRNALAHIGSTSAAAAVTVWLGPRYRCVFLAAHPPRT